MEDYRLDQSGQEVQDILDNAVLQSELTAETERATEAEQTLQGNIDAEATRAQGAEDTLQDNIDAEETRAEGAEGTLQDNIDAEEARAKAAEKQNADDIDAIEEKIPSGASASNKLATEEYVNDSVATATATFRGTYNVVTDLNLLPSATHSQISASLKTEIATADSNDYAFVLIPTSVETPEEIEKIERYKYNGSVWGFEYVLNNSGFTAAQWAAINSGITSGDVSKLAALPTNDQLTTLLAGKQDTLTFDNVPTPGSSNPVKSGGVYSAIKSEETRAMEAESQVSSAIEAILLLIPSAASALNQLADKAFVNSSIATATATFRGTYNLVTDLSLNVNATHSQIAGALGINISTADNNDYAFVQIPTSLETPTEIRVTERYKFNGTSWAFEYDLNNSGFTAAQWAAINSGITIALVGKLNGLPTNAELTTLLNGKQDTLTFDNVPTQGSTNPVKSSGIYNVIKAITDLIPAEATEQNQLADKADVAAKIVAAIPSWKGQYDALTDLQAVTGAKAGDMGCVKTTDSDGHAVLTFYQYSAQGAWVVYYTLRHYAQNKPATTGTTGDYPYNGMGRIELQKNIVNGVNTLTQAMLTQQNTIYVIQYDFTLGEDITVPANCVLEFHGGSISGGYQLTMNGCYIEGDAKFNVSSFDGTIGNKAFNVMWLMDSDWGQKVNKAQQYFKNLYSPAIDIEFQTPVVISGYYVERFINFESNLTFTGIPTNLGTAITLIQVQHSTLLLNSLYGVFANIDYSQSRSVHFIGLLISNTTGLSVEVNKICSFNECVRFQASQDIGCVENTLRFNIIEKFNYGVRIYQDTAGWTNDNKVIGNQFKTYPSDGIPTSDQYAVKIAGPKGDAASYLPNPPADPYDTCSCFSLEGTSFEHLAYAIFTRSVTGLRIKKCREEAITGLFYFDDGAIVSLLDYTPFYNTTKFDNSHTQNAAKIGLLSYGVQHEIEIGKCYTAKQQPDMVSDGCCLADLYGRLHNTNSWTDLVGVIVKTDNPFCRVRSFTKDGAKSSIYYVMFLDSEFHNITNTIAQNYPDGFDTFVYYSGMRAFRNGTTPAALPVNPFLAKAAPYMFIGKLLNSVEYGEKLLVETENPIIVDILPKVGTTANRPTNGLPGGICYQDMDLGKPIWWNGTAWVDATGTPV